MKHEPLIHLPWNLERDAPNFEGNDIKSPEGFIRYILKKYTKKGDTIFDPFTGLGTTMFVAEEMKRIPFGFEAEEEKFEWVAGQIENWTHLIHDDAANLHKYKFPKMDLVLTSPPYMQRHCKWNPLFGGDPKHAGYDKYLKRMTHIFDKTSTIMKRGALLIVQIDNLYQGKHFTPLAHDIASSLSKHFIQINETTVIWDNPKADYLHTNLLIFKKRA